MIFGSVSAARLAVSLLPDLLLVTATVTLCLILSLYWIWEHRAAGRRKRIAVLTGAAERVLGAGSPAAVHQCLADALAEFSGATRVHLYVYDRGMQCLEKVSVHEDAAVLAIDPESPPPGLAVGAAQAFRNRTLFSIADTRRSSVLAPGFDGPRSVVFVPLSTQGELLGILEVDHAAGTRHFSPEERAALQHLGNLVAASIKFQQQEHAREQMFRTGCLLSAAQLMSGVAAELRAPLENMSHAASRLLATEDDPGVLAELRLMAAETAHATEIAARLISFGRADREISKTVELNSLVSSTVRRRESEWQSLGIKAQTRVSRARLEANGPRSQLEQVLTGIFIYAEHRAAESQERELSVATVDNGRRASVEITCSCPENAGEPGAELSTWQAIIAGYGGDIRFSRLAARKLHLDIELPLAAAARTGAATRERRPARTLTTLVVEPDPGDRKKLLKDLSAHGHRVVPTGSAEEGIDLAQRMRFDAVMCSPRLPGLNWVKFFERVRGLAGVFVLMIDGFQSAEGPWLDLSDGLVLNRSAYDADLDRVLREVDAALDCVQPLAAGAAKPGV